MLAIPRVVLTVLCAMAVWAFPSSPDAGAATTRSLLTAGFSTPRALDQVLPEQRETKPQIAAAYGQIPLGFELNRGQTDPSVRFLARGLGHTVFLTPTETALALSGPGTRSASEGRPPAGAAVQALRLRLASANPTAPIMGLDELPGKANYLLGQDPAQWHTNIPTYSKVRYQDVYPGVDLVYYGNQQQLEYDLIVAPGADPGTIRLSIGGADSLVVDSSGDLVLGIAGEQVRQRRPVAYQETAGTRQLIPSQYVVLAEREVGFDVGAYDTGRPLVIDPVLVYSTYLGGNFFDSGNAIAVDHAGNAYVTGNTTSTDFPTQNPLQPTAGSTRVTAFVAKLNAAGSALVYSTYLGGSGGPCGPGAFGGVGERGRGIAVDQAGHAYVTGWTCSPDFPTQNALQPTKPGPPGSTNAFVTKLTPSGTGLVFSTYLGGNSPEGWDIFTGDEGHAIAVDVVGNAYVTGRTQSPDFPTRNAFQSALGSPGGNAFVTKFHRAGGLIYSTYLGGSGAESGNGIAVDQFGNAYVTGMSASSNFPVWNALQAAPAGGFYDAFVTKLDAAGSGLWYSTYLGGSGQDRGEAIAVDALGQAYVTGRTGSSNFPTYHALQPTTGGGGDDAFVTKLSTSGLTLVYSTYLGGTGDDGGAGVAADQFGNAYVVGFTSSTDFPTLDPLQATPGGVFVTKLNAIGSALGYSTYLGAGGGLLVAGSAIAHDHNANAYITGGTNADFPLQNPLQPTRGAEMDAFVARIADSASPASCLPGWPCPPPPCWPWWICGPLPCPILWPCLPPAPLPVPPWWP